MRLRKKILIALGATLLTAIVLFLLFIGPWPAYRSGFEGKGYYLRNVAAIDDAARLIKLTSNPGQLRAGWHSALMNPAAGVPMAGYGARHDIRNYFLGGAPKCLSTGVHDDLRVKALALSDGDDTVVIVGADMLLVPPNVADAVRREVARQTSLSPGNIFFGASHTHEGPGAWGEGLAAFVTGGKYDPKVVAFLAAAFTEAVVRAYGNMGPAKMAHGFFDAEQFIRNRARNAPVDTRLNYMIVEKESGERCALLRFSAHPTTVDDDFLQFTAEYPGFLQSALEAAMPDTTVAYIGGSVGSSSPKAPKGDSDIERAQAMGEELAKLVVANAAPETLKWNANPDIASICIPLEPPPFQLRLNQSLRFSPLFPKLLGVSISAWMQSARAGDLVMVGLPGDFSGEISRDWSEWAAAKGYELWPCSFAPGYVGYISPDKYYNDPKATSEYETGLMSWTGPHQEAFFTTLMKRMFERLTGAIP
ncbi:MAG TPA: neutral/alkaline non-lysosomal ceramidase N-terminal domain-containing protein [Candidatus Brocadiia bacterium]|nr:neutral/alkaline non-lysosomal ceramidase N-terminal domain-containing protein [Candidatus Brocadiia bacterium]